MQKTKTCGCCDEIYEVGNTVGEKEKVIDVDAEQASAITNQLIEMTAKPEFQTVFGQLECHEE